MFIYHVKARLTTPLTQQRHKILLILRMASGAQNINMKQLSSDMPKVQSLQFYRRPLPSSCIAFASEEGKRIFAEALATGNMNSFFKLCSQYRTQDEPAYCGLTSLVMALNVLEVDPGRIWKGPWRWYHEDMLDCCTPLQVAREKGINMEQFTCLAKCNNLTAVARSATDITSVDELRAQIKNATQREDVVFVASYSRQILGQSGDGHFSPIAGFHEERDLALILDTARFKYPPHWVPVTLLLDAMRPFDPDTGKPRGYVLLSSSGNQPALLLFRPSCAFTVDTKKGKLNSQLMDFAKDWGQWLGSRIKKQDDRRRIVHQALSFLLEMKNKGHLLISMFCLTLPFEQTKGVGAGYLVECSHLNRGLTEMTCAIKNLIKELETTETFKAVQEFFSTKSSDEVGKFLNLIQGAEGCVKEHSPDDTSPSCYSTSCCNKPSAGLSSSTNNSSTLKRPELKADSSEDCNGCGGTLLIGPVHAATLFLSAWPHATAVSSQADTTTNLKGSSPCISSSQSPDDSKSEKVNSEAEGKIGKILMDFIASDINKAGLENVKAEIGTIRFKLREVLKYHNPGLTSFCCSSP